MVVNLNSGAATGDTYSSSVAVYDSQGTSHTLTLTFTKSATANTWSPSYEVDSSGTIVPLTPDLTFNSSGQLIGGGSYTLDLSTYNIGTVSLNMANTSGGSTTQYASASTTNYAAQNGYPPGFLQGVSVDTDGIIYGKYSNGQNLSLYQLTLARFNTPGKLDREGNNLYSETQDSGTALTGAPGTNGLGLVNGNSLEQSNVDLANEFVHMILYQRGFQANSRVITTTDSMLEEVLAMKR
jgi:flagellar hook protein FlgE